VLVVVTPFRLGHCYWFVPPGCNSIDDSGIVLACLAKPRAIVCYGLYFIVTFVESIAQLNFCIAQNFEWKPVYVSSSHELCSSILSTMFIRVRLSLYSWRWLIDMFLSLTVKILGL
jgi:hypothetical protein